MSEQEIGFYWLIFSWPTVPNQRKIIYSQFVSVAADGSVRVPGSSNQVAWFKANKGIEPGLFGGCDLQWGPRAAPPLDTRSAWRQE